MICPMCKGERVVYQNLVHEIKLVQCPTCDGRGEVVVTNFDRITASPEKLAKWLNKHCDYCKEIQERCDKCPHFGERCVFKDLWLECLKEESEK